MNKKLFLFSNLIFISKINCIDLSKIEVFLDDKTVNTKDYIEIDDSDDDESDDESPVALIGKKNVSISKIEVELQDGILNFINISQIKSYLKKKEFKKIKIYLVKHENCCKNFNFSIEGTDNYFTNIPFEFIEHFYNLFNKDIKKENVDIFINETKNLNTDLVSYIFDDYIGTGYVFYYKDKKLIEKSINCFFIKDILTKKKIKDDFKSIIEKEDDDGKIRLKLKNLKDRYITFQMEYIKNSDDKNINVHINFDDINEKKKIISAFLNNPDEKIIYEFFNKKKIKLRGKAVDKYEPLFKILPNELKFKKEKNKYKKDEFVEKIRNDIKNYVKKSYKDIVFDIDAFFPKEKIKVYKKEEYLNNNEQKVEIENDEDIIYLDEVFVEFKAEDIIRLYSILPHIDIYLKIVNIKFDTTNENLKNKNLEFKYHDLLSDYLKENIFCQKDFEFIKDINNYKIKYNGTEYNPGQHINIDPNISKDIIFKILENDDDINKKIKDQEDKKQALISKIKSDLNNLKSNITNEMTSNKLREELNKIINSTKIEDQECKNLINEINVKIKGKVQKELESTKDVLQKHKLVNDALNDLLNNSKEKTVTDLQTSLNNILQNGYNPDEENKKLIEQIKSEINAKKNSKKDDQQNTTDNTDHEDNTKQAKKPYCCCEKCKSNR